MGCCRRLSIFLTTGLALAVPTSASIAAAGVNTAGVPTALARPDASTWMPDVAERVEELRQRMRQADADTERRLATDLRAGQWWRTTVVLPTDGARR